jgi:small subunit ribosomal protein S4
LPAAETAEGLTVRYTGPSCRQCRREGTKLFLKGTKCFTEKCPVERRPYAPGQHGQSTARRRKTSEYARQLREKQKIKRIYGVSERQFRNTFERVATMPGITGHNLLASLESRLDNMIYRMGFAASRKAARQLVRHRHVEIDKKTVDIPSYLVRPGQEVRVNLKSREQASVLVAMDQASRGANLSWLAVDRESFSGRMLERPARANIPIAAQEQLVVELYSK